MDEASSQNQRTHSDDAASPLVNNRSTARIDLNIEKFEKRACISEKQYVRSKHRDKVLKTQTSTVRNFRS